jgi:hypothetical protein
MRPLHSQGMQPSDHSLIPQKSPEPLQCARHSSKHHREQNKPWERPSPPCESEVMQSTPWGAGRGSTLWGLVKDKPQPYLLSFPALVHHVFMTASREWGPSCFMNTDPAIKNRCASLTSIYPAEFSMHVLCAIVVCCCVPVLATEVALPVLSKAGTANPCNCKL